MGAWGMARGYPEIHYNHLQSTNHGKAWQINVNHHFSNWRAIIYWWRAHQTQPNFWVGARLDTSQILPQRRGAGGVSHGLYGEGLHVQIGESHHCLLRGLFVMSDEWHLNLDLGAFHMHQPKRKGVSLEKGEQIWR